jgi:hypothetical protein
VNQSWQPVLQGVRLPTDEQQEYTLFAGRAQERIN